MKITNNFLAGIFIGVVIAFVFLRRSSEYDCSAIISNSIKVLTRQAARWTTASLQDKNSMVAVLHANYGAGYLWALQDVATDEQVKIATGIDMKKFTQEIIAAQDKATARMATLCPDYAPEPSYLTSIAKEGSA